MILQDRRNSKSPFTGEEKKPQRGYVRSLTTKRQSSQDLNPDGWALKPTLLTTSRYVLDILLPLIMREKSVFSAESFVTKVSPSSS